MKIMTVSDLHHELGSHHGVYEGEAQSWLLKVLNYHKPTALISCGDNGHAWTPESIKAITDLVPFHTIYGNHDNIQMLQTARNADGTHSLTKDGERRTIDGLEFGFINGIIAGGKKIKDGVPRQTVEEYLHAATKLVGVDVLVTHMSPRELASRPIHEGPDIDVMQMVLDTIGPRLLLSGHLSGPYKLAEIGPVTGVRIDSSPSEKHYAIITHKGTSVEIFNDYEIVATYDVPL